jgi:Putative DNA-binding domain
MTGLAAAQTAFLARIQDDSLPLPAGWTDRAAAGMAIYRNNYRTALVDALRETYARTARWVGEDAFRQAAAHHLILHPPSSWTLDAAGLGFDQTLAEIFVQDPEVAELAWTEWAMLQVFGARDAVPMNAAGFAAATAGFGEAQWDGLRLQCMPRLATRLITQDLPAIWQQLEAALTAEEDTDFVPVDAPLAAPLACHVYREGEQPVFVTAPAYEYGALTAMLADASFGAVCELLAEQLGPEEAAQEAGAMLGRWLHHGLIEAVLTSR